MKDELNKKILKDFAVLKVKTHSCLTDNNDKDEKSKEQRVFHKNKNLKL